MIWAKFWRRSKHNSHDGGEVKPDILKKKKDIKRKDRAQHLRSVRQSERFLAIVFFFPLRIIILASFCQMWDGRFDVYSLQKAVSKELSAALLQGKLFCWLWKL